VLKQVLGSWSACGWAGAQYVQRGAAGCAVAGCACAACCCAVCCTLVLVLGSAGWLADVRLRLVARHGLCLYSCADMRSCVARAQVVTAAACSCRQVTLRCGHRQPGGPPAAAAAAAAAVDCSSSRGTGALQALALLVVQVLSYHVVMGEGRAGCRHPCCAVLCRAVGGAACRAAA
jgi:hypothetical protein